MFLLVSSLAFAAPDLVFDNYAGVYDPVWDEIAFTVTVKNDGASTSSAFYLDLLTDGDDGDWTDCQDASQFVYFPYLSPGATSSTTFTVSGDMAQGPVYLFLDLDRIVAEGNENNNEGKAIFIDVQPGEPAVAIARNTPAINPPCLRADINASFGWMPVANPNVFYGKLRVF